MDGKDAEVGGAAGWSCRRWVEGKPELEERWLDAGVVAEAVAEQVAVGGIQAR
jgi:hypothetical protein